MSKSIPTVQKFMTTAPFSIQVDQALIKADELMREHQIRHLPVLKGNDLVGLITDRDIKLVRGFKGVDLSNMKVSDVSASEVFTVEPDAMLDEVCDAMASKKYGCAVVTSNHKLVGIFTWIDALKGISELLKTRLTK